MLRRSLKPAGGRRLNTRGDTIVEVLISIIVLSSVLASAYGVASRASKENLQTQEHSQALQLAQGQIETLKNYGSDSSAPAIASGTPFCFNSAGALKAGFPPGSVPLSAADDPLTNYPADCRKDINSAASCSNLCYSVALIRNPYSSDPNLYNVTVRWDGVNGGVDQVSLAYRFDR